MKKIKILHLVPRGFGGIDSYVFGHYKYMDQEKFQFDFITQNQGLKNAEKYKDFRYGVELLPVTAAQDKERFIQRVREIFSKKYDVLHLHTSYWTGFLLEELAQEQGIPRVIVHGHSTNIEEADSEKRDFLFQQHEELKNKFSADLATDFWACSRLAADWMFGEQIPRRRIQIIKNAIEIEKFRFNKQRRYDARMELGLSDSIVLGTVGRISYPKNHTFLIDLLEEVLKQNKNIKLVIVGNGELEGALKSYIQEKKLTDNVLLVGWKDNIEYYLCAMDCFLLPSRFEGFGVAALEAAACGLPCIVSAQVPEELEGVREVRRVPLDLSNWVSVLQEVLEKNSDRTNGSDYVRDAGYDVERQAKVLEKLYEY